MKTSKIIFIISLLSFILVAIVLNIVTSDKYMKNKISFTNVFQVAGNVTSSASRGVGSILPIDDLDEAKLGEEIKKRYREYNFEYNKEKREYLNSLLKNINFQKKKKFNYEIFLEESYTANAYAMPGGVIVVTDSLLLSVKSESELMAIIFHEIGHIENSHCFNAVKYELLARKIKLKNLGKAVDLANNILLKHSYSKTQENEADAYAFEMLKNSKYDVMALSKSFGSLFEMSKNEYIGNILEDYFRTHPYLEDRMEKFAAKGKVWQNMHPNEKRYIGVENLKNAVPLHEKDFGDNEWTN